jgi:hypothetical protein
MLNDERNEKATITVAELQIIQMKKKKSSIF